MKILVINGPNLNFLGIREPAQYGTENYGTLCEKIEAAAAAKGDTVEIFQNNCEGAIIDRLQAAYSDGTEGIIINPGAYTHYSYAIRDGIAAIDIPVAEVHISNVHAREEFRNKSVLSEVCKGVVCGFGYASYIVAMLGLKESLQ